MNLYLVYFVNSETKETGFDEVIGVFTSLTKAREVCKNNDYYIIRINADTEYAPDAVWPSNWIEYPTKELVLKHE